jgi:preprotein translocase subunit SecA
LTLSRLGGFRLSAIVKTPEATLERKFLISASTHSMSPTTTRLSARSYTSLRDRFAPRCFAPTKSDREVLSGVKQLADALNEVGDQDLRDHIISLRQQTEANEASPIAESILIQTLALARQALLRTTGMSAYDVQVLAGIAMSRGAIAEMQTGEGKTLTSAFPIVAHAITGRGVHVATVNRYLAERDFEFLCPALRLLGLSVGLSKDGDGSAEKQAAYACDVTFATGYELGFDFLRDQIALMSHGPDRLGESLKRELFGSAERKSAESQRGHAMAIIDEIDSVLIDEAITPLVLSSGMLSGVANQPSDESYRYATEVAECLVRDEHFVIDERTKAISLTEAGSQEIHGNHQVESPEISDNRNEATMLADLDHAQRLAHEFTDRDHSQPPNLVRPWRQYIESALRAKHIMQRDVNYVVRDDKVEIVDEYTGRIFSDRNWRDGLHQAVESKEGVTISEEKRTLARISRQRYFQRYEILCGMTGTISGHQNEMLSCYQLPIVMIPLRKPSQREELATRYFATVQQKLQAVVKDVIVRSKSGQPVLIGTRTIDQTHEISRSLVEKSITHEVLNGVQDADEATTISAAGVSGSITVATNMAGRGTDISLDEKALAAGGLHVVGFERNRSTRIDRQLLGRAGRQGNPGSGQFYVSAEDEIVQRFDPSLARSLNQLSSSIDGTISPAFDARVAKLQSLAEKESYQQRLSIMREELWLDDVRKAVSYE